MGLRTGFVASLLRPDAGRELFQGSLLTAVQSKAALSVPFPSRYCKPPFDPLWPEGPAASCLPRSEEIGNRYPVSLLLQFSSKACRFKYYESPF